MLRRSVIGQWARRNKESRITNEEREADQSLSARCHSLFCIHYSSSRIGQYQCSRNIS
jgi:hypothetical protein